MMSGSVMDLYCPCVESSGKSCLEHWFGKGAQGFVCG